MSLELSIEASKSEIIPPDVLELCNLAFGRDLQPLWKHFGPAVHSLGKLHGRLVSHAMWVRHDLQTAGSRVLATASVEGVATHPELRGRGYATRVLRHLIDELPAHLELSALCPADLGLYLKSGWELWRGPLRVKMPDGEIRPTPEERIMIRSLPGSPALDLDRPLTASWRPGEVW